ncbi:aspartate dehydrogenase [Paraburkholderia sp. J10-1]|uniref:aspartate dehydrogenase n=1 Tax=Paraburkholderia sp. J10-1 TaxID=2805430 RepID=UPI002AB61FCF|nr:aspartate dehydrogenase [Paraburkholderia sp. J10-1]
MNVGLIGCGAIGSLVYDLLSRDTTGVYVKAVFERPESHDAARKATGADVRIVGCIKDFLDSELDLVVECAGHVALRDLGPSVLSAGHDLLIASVGALADPSLESSLVDAATTGRSRLRIPSGALGGLDALATARLAGLRDVRYESHKAPNAWLGTPAEEWVGLDEIDCPTIVYEGTAREAARLFPKNANVAAAVALAGIGFEKTRVVLHADPQATGNTHRIKAEGEFGHIDISVTGRTLPGNPKTSMLAPYSLVRAIANLNQTLVVA